MHLKKGFTLVELLVAATIIGVLLVFATTQYRSSAAEARWNQAKTYAGQLANAVRQAQLDYENVQFSDSDEMSNVESGGTCPYTPFATGPFKPSSLITCNYLENGIWNEGKFEYHVCTNTSTVTSNCKTARALACVFAKCNARLPSQVKQYVYCISATGTQETIDASRCQ